MSETTTYRLEDFIAELSAVTLSDVLVSINPESKSVFLLDENLYEDFTIPSNARFNQLYKIAVQHKKTADIQSLCIASWRISWSYKGKEIHSPLFLIPVHCKWNKIKQEFQVSPDLENRILNPFLLHTFQKEFDLDLRFPETETLQESVDGLASFLTDTHFSFQLNPFQAIGNFHHHRYEIVKDLEEILTLHAPNELLQTLLGISDEVQPKTLLLPTENCFSIDPDQEKLFDLIQHQNCVIQGPPGTGKSQVLANLLAKLLKKGGRHLLVSEKKTALQVLENKLKSRKLHPFVYVCHSQRKAGDFVQHLKKNWRLLEKGGTEKKSELLLSKNYTQQFQLIVDKLNHSDLFQDHSLLFFQEFQESENYASIPYFSDAIALSEWEKYRVQVASIYQVASKGHFFTRIHQQAFAQLSNIDEYIRSMEADYRKLSTDFHLEHMGDLQKLIKLSARIQLMENESGKIYYSWAGSPKNQKKFMRLKKRYLNSCEQVELYTQEEANWIVFPNLSELESWLLTLEQGSWLAKRKLKAVIQKRLTRKNLDQSTVIRNAQTLFFHKKELLEIEQELREIGIEQPKHELSLVDYFLSQLGQLSENELNEVLRLEEDTRNKISAAANELKHFEKKIGAVFHLEPTESLADLLAHTQRSLPELMPLKANLLSLPQRLYKLLRFAQNCDELEAILLKSAWIGLLALFPDLAEFNGQKLKKGLVKIIRSEKDEHILFAKNIIAERETLFLRYQTILTTASVKLSPEDKILKKELKTGKAILVREFAKSKQHRSMRELMQGEAGIWIDLLCPIFLCTPGMVSKNFPLQQAVFSFVIFDEASQLALPKALPCLQRGERAIVAGDSQQMSPSSFFSGAITSVDLLHQASYYFPNHTLKHHYRSIHSELIAFSNKHFYNNELIVYPAAEKKNRPVNLQYIEAGVFEDRQNEAEAKALVKQLELHLQSGKSLGVVASSEQQLACIWKHIPGSIHEVISHRIEENTLFFKTLEQVQGEECDVLMISFGYAKNSAGEFHLRFGPLNQKNGIKRLNVLLTRAIEHIDFFTSVRAANFPISSNEAINLVRLYLTELEQETDLKQIFLPFNLPTIPNGNTLKIKQIQRFIPSIGELKTFHEVMEIRGWELEYEC